MAPSWSSRVVYTIAVLASFIYMASAKIDFIKKPLIKRLLESETRLKSLRMKLMIMTRSIVNDDHVIKELTSTDSKCASGNIIKIDHDENNHLVCEQGPANNLWGIPILWSEHYIALDFTLGVICAVVVIGTFAGLILAVGHTFKKDRDRKAAAEKEAKEYAQRCREKKRAEPKKPIFTENTTLNQEIIDDQPPIPYSDPILNGGLRSSNGISVPTYATSSSHQLLRVSEQKLECNKEYQDYMKSISAHVSEVDESGQIISHSDEQLVSVEAAGEVGVASRHALATTEVPGTCEAHEGGDSHDLFGGMHPPPVHIRDKEELMAFGAHLLDELEDVIPDEPTAPASHLALHLVSMSSILVGSGTGELPSMFASGESALASGDRLRCLAEGFLISPHTQNSEIRRSTMISLAENSLEEYERAIASSPVLCRAHVAYAQGICLYILGRYLDALKSFNEALAGPHKARAWHAKGKLLASQGDLAGSEHCLLKAMEVATESKDFLLKKALQADVDTVYDHLPEGRRRSSTADLDSASKAFQLKNKEDTGMKRTESGRLVRHNSMRSMEDKEEVALSPSQRQAQAAIHKVVEAAAKENTPVVKEEPKTKKSKWGVLRTAIQVKAQLNSRRPSLMISTNRRASISDAPPDIPLDLGQAVKEWQRRRSNKFYHVDEPEEEEEEKLSICPELRRRSSLKSPKTPTSAKSPQSAHEPSHESGGWERQEVKAGRRNSEAAAKAAGKQASDVFTSPLRRVTADGDDYLPPFTLEICTATVISAIVESHNTRRGSIVGEVDADATYKVIATVVDEVHGARPLQDQQMIEQSCVVSPSTFTVSSPEQPKRPEATALGMMASETLTHLDHAFQTNTTSVAADSEKVSVVEVEDHGRGRGRDDLDDSDDDMFDDFEDDFVQQQTTTTGLKWKQGGMLTIIGARTDSLIVLTLMKQTNIRDEDNPNMIERKGVCLGQVGVPLMGLSTALKMVQGRIVLACSTQLEHPSIWLRHEGPSSNQRDDWGVAGSLLSPTSKNNGQSTQNNMGLEEDAHVTSCSIKFRMHTNALLDTLESSRSCGASAVKEPPQNMMPCVPCALALLNPSEERDVMYGEGIEELYMVALTADRIICCVYDELGEPRSFKAVTTPLPPQNSSLVQNTTQTQDAYSMSVFCTNGGPKSLFALRHNREFPLKRLTSIREVSGPGCDDPRLELKFWLHVMDASHHEHGHGDSSGLGVEAKVLLGGNSSRRASMHARRSSIAASAHLDHALDHGEEFTKVVVVLRFKRDRKKQIRTWANALKKAVHLVPGSIFSMEHALADGGDPDKGRPVLAPMNNQSNTRSSTDKHVLFAPLNVPSSVEVSEESK